MATQDKSAVLGDVVNCALEPRDVRHTQTDIRRLAFMDTLSSEEMGRLSQLLTSAVSLAQVERGMLIPSNRVLQRKEVVG
jgi:hypothetical protein